MAISASNLKYAYSGQTDNPVVDIQTWEVAAGEQVFVQGPSGCGKSTLLNLLSGIITPSSGQLNVFGCEFDRVSAGQRDAFRARNIGYVFQQYNLVPFLSAVENILLARHFVGKKLEQEHAHLALSQLNIADSERTKPVRQLSIGQQQRVAIARAFINKPKLLLADEPTSSLDQNNRDTFIELLLSLAAEQKMTVLFVSHDQSLSHHFDRVVQMNEINQA